MPRTRLPRPPAALAPVGLIAGLLLTGSALALGAGPLPASSAEAVPALAAPSPSATTTTTAPPREVRRASRSGRTAMRPVRWVHREVAVGSSFTGRASWYGHAFAGQRTASGERFDPGALTAASRSLPLGTRLRVCRADRCVVVRINDRGPYVSGRVLDLSRAARDRLGSFGVARVTATPVERRRVAIRPPVPRRKPVSPAVVPPSPQAVQPVLAVAEAPSSGSPLPGGLLVLGVLVATGSAAAWLRRAPLPRLVPRLA